MQIVPLVVLKKINEGGPHDQIPEHQNSWSKWFLFNFLEHQNISMFWPVVVFYLLEIVWHPIKVFSHFVKIHLRLLKSFDILTNSSTTLTAT